MNNKKSKALYLTEGAIIAALYAVLAGVLWEFSSLAVQVRVAEALCILPAFSPSAAIGLYAGCLIANMMRGNIIDALFGSLATLIAALLTRLIAQKLRRYADSKWFAWLLPLPAVVVNAIAIPLILYYGYGFSEFLGFDSVFAVLGLYSLSVFIGQAISCYLLGLPLYYAVKKILKR